MTSVSISQLKINPSAVISKSVDYPVAVENRNTIQAYLIGKDLYEKIFSLLEDYEDRLAVKKADFSKGKDLDKIEKELGL